MTYLSNLLVALDQLGNTLAGGNPDGTISARVGYYAMLYGYYPQRHEACDLLALSRQRIFWNRMEDWIDWTFRPIDGDFHCIEAWDNDPGESYQDATGWRKWVLAGLVVLFCPPIAVIIRVSVWVNKRKAGRG